MPTINLGKVRLSNEGEWTAGLNYEALSLVTYNNEAFMSVDAVPPSTIPPTEAPDQWVKVGSKGDTGPKGDQGDQGLEGSIGPEGPRGLQGDTGSAGPQGIKGDTGAAGAVGSKGDPGPQGVQGVKGDTGATGPQGVKGNTGSTGAQGPQGERGATGPTPSLSSSVSSTSTTTAANSAAVKQAYDRGNAAAVVTQPLITANVFASPIPCVASGRLGQWKELVEGINIPVYVPDGGTWAYFAYRVSSSNLTPISIGPHVGIVSGGGLAVYAHSSYATKGFCWRIN